MDGHSSPYGGRAARLRKITIPSPPTVLPCRAPCTTVVCSVHRAHSSWPAVAVLMHAGCNMRFSASDWELWWSFRASRCARKGLARCQVHRFRHNRSAVLTLQYVSAAMRSVGDELIRVGRCGAIPNGDPIADETAPSWTFADPIGFVRAGDLRAETDRPRSAWAQVV